MMDDKLENIINTSNNWRQAVFSVFTVASNAETSLFGYQGFSLIYNKPIYVKLHKTTFIVSIGKEKSEHITILNQRFLDWLRLMAV